jgi:glycosyltransferase involved in cell wall biosynthesis
MHDNDFIQHYFNKGIERIGERFEVELETLEYYHDYICLSFDEMMFWSKFFPGKKFYFFPPANQLKELKNTEKTIDVLLIGANNPHNIAGAYWFLDEVCPRLSENISITFCGRFISGFQHKYSEKIIKYNIFTIDFAENVERLYEKTKIVIVPILNGTGIKIKTLEAFSYSIPIVSTLMGVDGLPDKYENGCLVSNDPVEFALNIKKLLENDDFYNRTKEKQKNYYMKYLSFERNLNIIKEIFTNEKD